MANPDSPVARNVPHLTLKAAQVASAAAIAKAEKMNVPVSIAIEDTSMQLIHFQRMPGAKYASVDISINKAFTAASLGFGTHTFKESVWPGGSLYGINHSNGGRFTTIGGGLPIEVNGQLIGAIGCSSGTAEEDQMIAQAGVDAVLEYSKS